MSKVDSVITDTYNLHLDNENYLLMEKVIY